MDDAKALEEAGAFASCSRWCRSPVPAHHERAASDHQLGSAACPRQLSFSMNVCLYRSSRRRWERYGNAGELSSTAEAYCEVTAQFPQPENWFGMRTRSRGLKSCSARAEPWRSAVRKELMTETCRIGCASRAGVRRDQPLLLTGCARGSRRARRSRKYGTPEEINRKARKRHLPNLLARLER